MDKRLKIKFSGGREGTSSILACVECVGKGRRTWKGGMMRCGIKLMCVWV
jgi:hypothetical protein